MPSKILKSFKEFFRNFDYFGVQFYFHYKSKEKYHSLTGGIAFLIFLIVGISYSVINAIPLVKRQKMNIIYYTMELSKTDTINFEHYSNNIALGVSTCENIRNSSEFWEVFKLDINHVQYLKENGVSKKKKTPIEFGKCQKSDFYNQFDSSFDNLGLQNFFCMKNKNHTIQGIFTDPIFEYIEITLEAKDEQEETFKKIKNILSDECDFSMYNIDVAFQLSNYSSPAKKYLNTKFITLKYDEFSKMNSYFKLQDFDSYQNFLFDNRHSYNFIGLGDVEIYSITKGSDRLESKVAEFTKFAKLYLRAGLKRNIIERRYMKLTEFAANVTSILSTILLIMYVIFTYVNKFYAHESIMKKIFKFYVPQKSEADKSIQNDIKQTLFQRGLFNECKEPRNKSTTETMILNEKTARFGPLKASDISQKKFDSEVISFKEYKRYTNKKAKFVFNFNLVELIFVKVFPCCIWSNLKTKTVLLKKAYDKLFFQSDIMNYLKSMQLLELVNFCVLEPYQNTILQFLSKPSISLAQKKDIYDKIRTVNDIHTKEIEEVYTAIRVLSEKKNKTSLESRLYNLTKIEMNKFIKKLKYFNK